MLTTQTQDLRSPSLSSASARSGQISNAALRHGKLWSNLKDVCDLLRIPASPVGDDVQFQHVQYKSGQRIHTIGQSFDMLYIVYSGFLKSVIIDESGNEQVLGFPMKGDLFGMDGIYGKQYSTEAVALSNCEIILLPFKTFMALGRSQPELEAALYGVMSRELVREQSLIGALGSLSAEARVARFLVSLSDRFSAMGYSGRQFNLRMTRQEIGNYLGLTLETVSRTLSAFNTIGLISVDQRAIVLHDIPALKTLRRLPPSRVRARQESARAGKQALTAEAEMPSA